MEEKTSYSTITQGKNKGRKVLQRPDDQKEECLLFSLLEIPFQQSLTAKLQEAFFLPISEILHTAFLKGKHHVRSLLVLSTERPE